MPRHITVTRRWPERYFTGLSPKMRLVREKELLKRRVTAHPTLAKTNTLAKPKKSKWTQTFHKVYPGLSYTNIGLPKNIINQVYNKGLKAWKTGGSRVGATPQQWALARVYKFILITKKKVPRSWYEGKNDPNAYLRSF